MNGSLFLAAGSAGVTTTAGALLILYAGRRWPLHAKGGDGRAIGGPALLLGIIIGMIPILSILDPLLILAGAVIIIIGLVDDLVDLCPWQKLLGQGVAAALATIALAPSVHSLSFAAVIPLGNARSIIVFLWILTLINAVNLIDGLDGLVVSVLLPSLLVTAAIATMGGYGGVLAAATIGALIGLYPFNRRHGRLLLGDTGAESIGYLLAILTLTSLNRGEGEWAIIPAFLIAVIPLTDTAFAVLRRLAGRRSIFRRDQGHIHHRLAARIGEQKAVAALAGISFVASALALFLWWWGL